jgi:hypothetical protein
MSKKKPTTTAKVVEGSFVHKGQPVPKHNMDQQTKRRLRELSSYIGKSRKLGTAMNTFIEYNVPLDDAHKEKFVEILHHAQEVEYEIIRAIDKLYTGSHIHLEDMETGKKVTVSPFRE